MHLYNVFSIFFEYFQQLDIFITFQNLVLCAYSYLLGLDPYLSLSEKHCVVVFFSNFCTQFVETCSKPCSELVLKLPCRQIALRSNICLSTWSSKEAFQIIQGCALISSLDIFLTLFNAHTFSRQPCRSWKLFLSTILDFFPSSGRIITPDAPLLWRVAFIHYRK